MTLQTPKIPQPRLRVQLENADGTVAEYDVQTDNRDAVRFDLTRVRLGWPDGQSAPVLWMTFQAWSALKRSGIDVGKVDAFMDRCLSVQPLNDDGEDLAEGEEHPSVDPSQTAVEQD